MKEAKQLSRCLHRMILQEKQKQQQKKTLDVLRKYNN